MSHKDLLVLILWGQNVQQLVSLLQMGINNKQSYPNMYIHVYSYPHWDTKYSARMYVSFMQVQGRAIISGLE